MFAFALVRLLVATLASAAVTPGQPGDEVAVVRARIQRSLHDGSYAAAVDDARALVARLTSERGPSSFETAQASDLLVDALVRNGQAASPATLSLAQEIVGIKELHRRGADTAVSVHRLGDVRFERGDLATALTLHERALALRLTSVAPDAPEVADSLDRIAATLIRMERFPAARQRIERALVIREARAEREPLALAGTLEQLCWLQRDAGDAKSAQASLARVLALRQPLGADHPDMARTQLLAGDLLWMGGNSASALEAWRTGMAAIERRLGADHPAMVSFARRLAYGAESFGDRPLAERFVIAGLRAAERTLAPCGWDRLGIEASAASLRAYEGVYLDARGRYRASLDQCEKCLGHRHSSTATIVYNLALLARRMGDHAEAERLLDRATRTWSASLGASHPYVARGLEGLADVAADRGQYGRARALYERSLALRRRAPTQHAPLIGSTLASLARTLAESGDLATASRHVAEALRIYEDTGGTEDPDSRPRVLALRGDIETRRGDRRAAQASFAAALAERDRVFGASHPLTARVRADLASAALQLHDYDAALAGALAAEDAGRDHLRFTIRYLPERQAMTYSASRPRGLDLALSVGATNPQAQRARLFDAAIRSRGVILDELAQRARSAGPQDPAAAPLVARAANARQRYANLIVRSLQDVVPRARLDAARKEKEDAEQALAEQSVAARTEVARVQVGLDAVREAVPADAALVSFVRYSRTIVSAASEATPAGKSAASSASVRWRPPVLSYAAFVQRAGPADPVLVPLGTAASIDALVTSWRDEASGPTLAADTPLADAERVYRTAGLRLRRAIWDPLAPYLLGSAHIFVVPDGQLNVVSLASLPSRAGRYLADEPATIHYLSTERDLVMPAGTSDRTGLLAVGGATFDGQSTPPSEATAQRSACEAFSRMRFLALPGSRREVTDIRRAWPEGHPDTVTVLSGTAATETAVKRAVSGRRVVHLATHGFFLGGECIPGLVGTRGVGGLVARGSTPSETDNPLLLSGLALAWANRRDKARTSEDDGILTAEEIAGLNLQGTEWAVLSACDTGLGEIKAGEGVFGLRRAFQVAGARTVIMSLWAVQDTAARVWMRALYDGRFRQRLSTADAVRDASRAVLAARRAQRQSTHPFFWAGFVAAGDWR